MNTKANSLTSWTFGIFVILLLIIILQTQVLNSMNKIYGGNYSTGLNTEAFDSFKGLTDVGDAEVEGAEIETGDGGLTSKNAWTTSKKIYTTLRDFIDGTFMYNLADILDLPKIIPLSINILMWISLILILIYILTKVIP